MHMYVYVRIYMCVGWRHRLRALPDTPIINNMAEGRSENSLSHIDLRKSHYNQSTYFGRARHFFEVTDPRNVLASSAKLEEARDLVTAHR